jgi:hypothetical protein
MVTMTTRIDFVDHILSQELLDLVSKWNKGLPTPEYVFPLINWAKDKKDIICNIVRKSLPALTTAMCFSFFISYSQHLDKKAALTTAILTDTVLWGMVSVIIIFLSLVAGRSLSSYINKQLSRIGRFASLELTRGDKNRQVKLLARSKNSLLKFAGTSFATLIFDVVAAVIAAILLKK